MDAHGNGWRILHGDVIERLRDLPDKHFHCVCTSPPYWGLRDYGVDGQIGLEKTLAEFISKLGDVFAEVHRVLRDDGTCWVNMGDGYSSGGGGSLAWSTPTEQKKKRVGQVMPSRISIDCKPKNLLGQPWRLAFALQDAGWYLRQDIIWAKRSPMPESVRDRCTKAHEYIFLLSKSPRYFYDAVAVSQPQKTLGRRHEGRSGGRDTMPTKRGFTERALNPNGANLRSVWTLSPEPFSAGHFAVFPSELPRRCILAGTSEHGCCAECGAPWVRVVDRKAMVIDRSERTHSKGRTRSSGTILEPPRAATTGWKPSCSCSAGEIVPCRVLDPFSGAGTTVMVARRLHRHGVGIELNPEYLAMSAKRIQEDAPLFN